MYGASFWCGIFALSEAREEWELRYPICSERDLSLYFVGQGKMVWATNEGGELWYRGRDALIRPNTIPAIMLPSSQ